MTNTKNILSGIPTVRMTQNLTRLSLITVTMNLFIVNILKIYFENLEKYKLFQTFHFNSE